MRRRRMEWKRCINEKLCADSDKLSSNKYDNYERP